MINIKELLLIKLTELLMDVESPHIKKKLIFFLAISRLKSILMYNQGANIIQDPVFIYHYRMVS